MKKRYVLTNKKRFIIAIAIVISVIGASFFMAFHKISGYSETAYIEIVVSRGDTMWDIIQDVYGENTDIRRVISSVKRVNNMENTDIYEGQVIVLPVK